MYLLLTAGTFWLRHSYPNPQKTEASGPLRRHGRRSFQAHLRQTVTESISGQSQQARRLALVALGALQRLPDDGLLVFVQGHALGQQVIAGLSARARRCLELYISRVQSGARA